MSAATSGGDLGLPFPVEFLIRETPRSLQSSRAAQWKQTVGGIARDHVATLGELFYLDDRPLAVTILYFPPDAMQGDVDNIVKPILDGMIKVIYLDDHVLERVTVQKLEPGVGVEFRFPTPALARAIVMERPVIYIRIDDDLSWRELP